MTDDELTTACPNCDSSDIHARVNSFVDLSEHRDDPDTAWYCNACGEGFDDPKRRERYVKAQGYHGDAETLLDADPDEFP